MLTLSPGSRAHRSGSAVPWAKMLLNKFIPTLRQRHYAAGMPKFSGSAAVLALSIAATVAAGQTNFALEVSDLNGILLQAASSDSAPLTSKVSSTLTVKGPTLAPLVLEPSDLKAYRHVTIKVHNDHTNADESYSGVALADLLAKQGAPLGKDLHGQALANYVVATGSDGYKALLSLAEIDAAFHSGQVIVADQLDAKPLEKDGPYKLIVSEDKRPARWVRNLVLIEIKEAQ